MSIVLKLTSEILRPLAISLQMVLIQKAKKWVPNRNAISALLRATTPVVNASMWSRGEKKKEKKKPPNQKNQLSLLINQPQIQYESSNLILP